MEINRTHLLDVLKRCMPGVDTGGVLLEGADTFIFTDKKVYTYNDIISVMVPIDKLFLDEEEESLEGAVKAKEFYNLLSKMKDDVVKIINKDDEAWIIKSGKAKATLTLLNANTEKSLIELSILEMIKQITEDIEWSPLPENFNLGLGLCKFGNNKSSLSGIYVSDLIMCSTDEMRLNYFDMKEKVVEPFWIADMIVGELLKFDNFENHAVSNQWVHFETSTGTVFSCKRLNHESYPIEKVKELVKTYSPNKDDKVIELPLSISEAVSRAASLAMDVDSHDAVRVTFTTEKIDIYSERASGKFQEKVMWSEDPGEMDETVVYLDHNMVEYGLQRSSKFCIKKVKKDAGEFIRIVFTGGDFIHIVSTLKK